MNSSTPPLPPAPGASRQRPALVAPLLLTLAVVLVSMLAAPSPARAEPPASVTVEDTVGVVDVPALSAELEGVDFRRPVDLRALVLDVREQGLDPADDRALNDAVLAHARQDAPQLLSADGEHFADGLVVLAIDPQGRFLGTYAGEDVKLSEGGFDSVQDDMREAAADEQWQQAFVDGARTYATLLDRPWWQHPGTIVAAAVAAGALLVTGVSILLGRRTARRRVDESLPRYEDVVAARRLTDTAARNLPEHSPYAPAALRDHERYSAQLTRAEELHEQLPLPRDRRWGWGLRGPQRRLARDYRTTVAELDDLDDDIIAAHDLLHRIGDWREGWERETAPLREAVTALEESLELPDESAQEPSTVLDEEGFSPGFALEDTAGRLRCLATEITDRVEELTTGLETDTITPDAALAGLDELTEQLSGAVEELRDLRLSTLAEDEEEADLLRGIDADLEDDTQEYRSLRERRRTLEVGAGGSGGSWHLNPVLWYSMWSTESHSQLESHRNPQAGSSGTSGFSSGGFSGAGSSSRF